jgi:myo-inositol-1-phosphate synthase
VLLLPGFHTALDIPLEESHHDVREARSVRAIVEGVQQDIVGFRDENELEEIVVVYAASPPRSFQPADNPDPDFADERENESLPASVLYAAGAAQAGAHFIDFTPSETLELQALHALAARHGTQLAGRDGSTGQTMFKMTLGELLRNRRLRVRSWYSTNLIGNHDGYILSLPGHDTVKLRDKTDGLGEVLGYDDFEHLVRIEYLRRYGDDKRAWDSIECDGWLGSQLQISIDWRGQDSFLAAPLVLDLCRLVDYGSRFDLSGIQPQLGWFFKRPLGSDVLSPSVAFERMVHFYRGLADRPSE